MDKSRALYDKLSANKLYTKSYDEFVNQFGTPEGQSKLYNALSSQKLYTKSQDEFANQFWSNAPAAPEVKKKDATELSGATDSSDSTSSFLGNIQDIFSSNTPVKFQTGLNTFDTSKYLKENNLPKPEYGITEEEKQKRKRLDDYYNSESFLPSWANPLAHHGFGINSLAKTLGAGGLTVASAMDGIGMWLSKGVQLAEGLGGQAAMAVATGSLEPFNMDTHEKMVEAQSKLKGGDRVGFFGELGQVTNDLSGVLSRNVKRDMGFAEDEMDKGITDLATEGKVGKAAGLAVFEVFKNAPQMALLAATGGTAGAVFGGATALGAGTSAVEEYEKDKQFSYGDAGVALAKGLVEGMTETIFRTDIEAARSLGKSIMDLKPSAALESIKNLIKDEGADAAKREIIRDSKVVMKKMLGGGFEEGSEEILATIGDFIIDTARSGKWNEVDYNKLLKQTVDSFIIGAASGGLMSGAAAYATYSPLEKEQQKKVDRFMEIANNETLSQEVRDMAQKQADDIVKYNADKHYAHYTQIAELPIDQRLEAVKILTDIKQLKNDKEEVKDEDTIAKIDKAIDEKTTQVEGIIDTRAKDMADSIIASPNAIDGTVAFSPESTLTVSPNRGYVFHFPSLEDVPEALRKVIPVSKGMVEGRNQSVYRVSYTGSDLIKAGLATEAAPVSAEERAKMTDNVDNTTEAVDNILNNTPEALAPLAAQFEEGKDGKSIGQQIAEAYHEAKQNNTNPELISQVDEAINNSLTAPTLTTQPVVTRKPRKARKSNVLKGLSIGQAAEITDNIENDFSGLLGKLGKGTKRILQNYVKALKSISPDAKLFYYEDAASMKQGLINAGMSPAKAEQESKAGGLFTTVKKTGQIVIHVNRQSDLVKEKGKSKGYQSNIIAAHEIIHAALKELARTNPAEFIRMKNDLLDMLARDESANQDVMDFVARYSNRSEAIQAEEFLAQLGALITRQQAELKRSTLHNIKIGIREFLKSVAKRFRSKALMDLAENAIFSDTARIEDTARFLEGLGKSMREGTEVDMKYIKNLVKGSDEYQNGLRQSILANYAPPTESHDWTTLMNIGLEEDDEVIDIKNYLEKPDWISIPENAKRMKKYMSMVEGMTEDDVWLAKAISYNENKGIFLYDLRNKEAIEAALEGQLEDVKYNVQIEMNGGITPQEGYLFQGWLPEVIAKKIEYFIQAWNANEYLRWTEIQTNERYKKLEINSIRNTQGTSLLENIDGFIGHRDYDMGFKYMLIMNSIYNKYSVKNKETGEIGVISRKQAQLSKSESSFPTLELDVVKALYNNKEATNSSADIGLSYFITYLNTPRIPIQQTSLAKYILRESSTGEGTWLRFPQTDDVAAHQDLFKLARTSHKYLAKWCIGESDSYARDYSRRGDFYIFVDNKTGDARIAARYNGQDKIAEVRGLGLGQMILPEDKAVIEEFVKDFPDGAAYDSYQKTLKDIDVISKEFFTQEEDFKAKTQGYLEMSYDRKVEFAKYIADNFSLEDVIRMVMEEDRSYGRSDNLLNNVKFYLGLSLKEIQMFKGESPYTIMDSLTITENETYASEVKYVLNDIDVIDGTHNFINLISVGGRIQVYDGASMTANELITVNNVQVDQYASFKADNLRESKNIRVSKGASISAPKLEEIDGILSIIRSLTSIINLPKIKKAKEIKLSTIGDTANGVHVFDFPDLEKLDKLEFNVFRNIEVNVPSLKTVDRIWADQTTSTGEKITINAQQLNFIWEGLLNYSTGSKLTLNAEKISSVGDIITKNDSEISIITRNNIRSFQVSTVKALTGKITLPATYRIGKLHALSGVVTSDSQQGIEKVEEVKIGSKGHIYFKNIDSIDKLDISYSDFGLTDFTPISIKAKNINAVEINTSRFVFITAEESINSVSMLSGSQLKLDSKYLAQLKLYGGNVFESDNLRTVGTLDISGVYKFSAPELNAVDDLKLYGNSEELSKIDLPSLERADDIYIEETELINIRSISFPKLNSSDSIVLSGFIRLIANNLVKTESVNVKAGSEFIARNLDRSYNYNIWDLASNIFDYEGRVPNELDDEDTKQSLLGDIGQPSRKEHEKRKKQSFRDKLADIYRSIFERNEEARKALKKEDMDFSLYTMYLKAGATPWAMRKFANYFVSIYKGLNEVEKRHLDSIIFLERVIAIDTNFDNRKKKRPSHPAIPQDNGPEIVTNKESAQAELDKYKQAWGEEKYNDLQSRKDLYFKAFSDLLKYKYDNGLISKESYELYKDYNYSPRKFLKEIIDGNGISPKTYAIRGINLGTDEIKNIEHGSVDYMLFDSETLLKSALISAENKVMTNRALKFLFTEGVIRNSEVVKDANYDTYKNGQIKLNADGTPKVKEASNGFVNKKYKDNNGKVYTFQLRSDVAEQFDDARQADLKDWQVKVLGWASGSIVTRNMAVNLNLFFGLINPIIDLGTQVMFSNTYKKAGSGLIRQSIAAASTFVGITKELMAIDAREWLSNRGIGSDPLGKNTELRQLIQEYGQYGGWMTTQNQESNNSIWTPVSKLGKFLGYYGNITEVSSKLAAFKFIKETKLQEFADTHKDPTTGESIEPTEEEMQNILIDAAYHARATLDYNRGGEWAKKGSNITAFLNVNLQVKKIGGQYIVNNKLDFTRKMMDGIYLTAAITLANLLISSDDYEKDKRIKKEKVSKTVIMLPFTLKDIGLSDKPDRAYIPLPTPSLSKAFFNIGQLIAESMYYKTVGRPNPNQGSAVWKLIEDNYKMFANELVGILLPPTAKEFVEYKFNYDLYTGDVLSRDASRGLIDSQQGKGNEEVLGLYKWIAESLDKLTDKDDIGYGAGYQISPEKFQKSSEAVITSSNYNPITYALYWITDNMFNATHKVLSGQELPKDMQSKYMKQSAPEAIAEIFGKGFGRLLKFTDTSKYDEPDFDTQQETKKDITLMDARLETRRAELYDDLKDIYTDAKQNKLSQEKLAQKYDAYKATLKDPKDYNYVMAIGQMFIDRGKVKLPLNADKYYDITGLAKDPRAKAYALWKHFGDVRANEDVINDLTALGLDQSVGHEYEGILIENGLIEMDDKSKPMYSDWYKTMVSKKPAAKKEVETKERPQAGFYPPLNIIAKTPINNIASVAVGAALGVTAKVADEIANIYNKLDGQIDSVKDTVESKLNHIKDNFLDGPIVQNVKDVIQNPDLIKAAYQRWVDKQDESGQVKTKIVLPPPKAVEPEAVKQFSLTGGLPVVGSDTSNVGNLRLSNSDYLTTSSIIDLNQVNVGHRNRGDYQEGQTNLAAQFLHRFESAKNLSKDFMYAAVKNGKVILGTADDVKDADVATRTPFLQVRSINTNNFYNRENYLYPTLDAIKDIDSPARALNISATRNGNIDANNKFAGGAVILETPDKQQKYIVRGSVSQVKNAFDALMGNTKSQFLNMYILDNGSFSTGLTTNDNKSTPEELRAYEAKNVNGGHSIFIK